MSHKDGRVVLSAWVDPVLRDYAREAARPARGAERGHVRATDQDAPGRLRRPMAARARMRGRVSPSR